MARALLLLTTFAALAAWAGAQGVPASLDAADQVKLLKLNRPLVGNLVERGLDMAEADNPEKRAKTSREMAQSLANSIERAANNEQDPDRVAELTDLIAKVVRDGLTPNLEEALQTNPPGSPGRARLIEIQKNAVKDLADIPSTIPAGKVGDNQKVQDALARLAELKSALGK